MLQFLPAAGDLEAQKDESPPAAATTPQLDAHLSLGFTVASYAWSGLELTVRDKMTGKPKRLLQGCAGTALSGDFVALMGPSGEPSRLFQASGSPMA